MLRRHSPLVGSRFALCISNKGYLAALELHKIYRVLPDAAARSKDLLRIVDESGEDYLYPADFFVLIKLPKSVQKVISK